MTEEERGDRRIIHGVLMAVLDRGTLILGGSGTGKSELALELISRGHRLVADDAVQISRRGESVYGEAPELTAGILAIDGLGLVDVAEIFGPAALQAETKIDLCIDLKPDPEPGFSDLLSDECPAHNILGVPVPLVALDVSRRPANPLIVETAVRMLDHSSAEVARRLVREHDSSLSQASPVPR